jgi:hypothetical protein
MKTFTVIFIGIITWLFVLHTSSATPGTYGQVLIHTADGATYIVTTDDASFVYKQTPSGVFAICMTMNNAVGLPPATNDIVFRSGFEQPSLCFE